MNLSQIRNLEYYEIFEYYISQYVEEFGEKKLKEIFEKIMTSNKISGLISTSKFQQAPPSANDYLYSLNEIPYFLFCRGQTQGAAALLALQRWHLEVNSELFLISDLQLQLIAVKIIETSKKSFF